MKIIRNGVSYDIITLRYDSKCAACGGKILADTEATWHPESKWSHGRGRVKTHSGVLMDGTPLTSRMRYPGSAKMVGTVTHHPDSPCANEYRVKAVYDCTAKTLLITAYRAEMALDAAYKRLNHGVARPSVYIVYQGNVPVLTRLQKDVKVNA